MVATNDDLLNELKQIKNLLQGMYVNQDLAENIKNSLDAKKIRTDYNATK